MPAGQCCGKVKHETGDEHLVMLRWINKTLHASFLCRIQNSSLNKITTQPFWINMNIWRVREHDDFKFKRKEAFGG
jgi:hypothetical protein